MTFKMCTEKVKRPRHCTDCGSKMKKGETMHVYNWGDSMICEKCEEIYNKQLKGYNICTKTEA